MQESIIQLQVSRQILVELVLMVTGVHKVVHQHVQMNVEQVTTAQVVVDKDAVLASIQRQQHYH